MAAHLDAVQAIDVESLTVLSGLHAGDACFDSVQAEVQGIHFRATYGEIGSCAAQCTARSATHDVLRTVLLGHAVKAFHVPACFIIAGEGYVAVGYGLRAARCHAVHAKPRGIAYGRGLLEVY